MIRVEGEMESKQRVRTAKGARKTGKNDPEFEAADDERGDELR